MRAIVSVGRTVRTVGEPVRAAVRRDAALTALFAVVLCGGLALTYGPGGQLGLASLLLGLLLPGGAIAAILLRRPQGCGPADQVTLSRAAIAGGCATLLAGALLSSAPVLTWPMFTLGVTALVLDAVDGLVARATLTSSLAGARFDMETDAAVLLLLSVVISVALVPWAWVIGAMRYVFAAVALVRPVWRSPLPRRPSRRVIAAGQGFALGIALAPVIGKSLASIVLAIAVAPLLYSFGRDAMTLERRARERTQ